MDDWFCESRNHRREASLRAGILRSSRARTRRRARRAVFSLDSGLTWMIGRHQSILIDLFSPLHH